MTRINCISVSELNNKMLLAEYRELPRISAQAKVTTAPLNYVLGSGHVKFFYDKGEFLRKRFEEQIVPELIHRGFKIQFTKYRMHPAGLNNDWIPSPRDMEINKDRIEQRLSESRNKKLSLLK